MMQLNHNKVDCDHSSCPEAINLAAIDIEHMRKVLAANGWWMDSSGDVVHDEISGADFVAYKTYCPAHRNSQ